MDRQRGWRDKPAIEAGTRYRAFFIENAQVAGRGGADNARAVCHLLLQRMIAQCASTGVKYYLWSDSLRIVGDAASQPHTSSIAPRSTGRLTQLNLRALKQIGRASCRERV